MQVWRWLLLVVGVLVALSGLVWMGQGSGVFPYPKQSFMINQHPWIWRGAGTVAIGLLLIAAARTRRAPR